MTKATRSCALVGVCLLGLALSSPAAFAARHVRVYTGGVGGHGMIRIDIEGSRARAYFELSCRSAPGSQPDLFSTSEGVREPGSISPISGRVRRGRLSIMTSQVVEEHDEAAAGDPVFSIAIVARVTGARVSGRVSVEQSEVPGLDQDPTLSIPGCSTGELDFTANRRRR